MRKYVARISYTTIGITLALLGAPAAHADNASFVAAAHALGFPESPDYLVKTGPGMCLPEILGQLVCIPRPKDFPGEMTGPPSHQSPPPRNDTSDRSR